MTIHGVDVSSFQPNWKPAANDAFVFVKATQGTGYTNPSHNAQVERARHAGLVVGHYHFLVPGSISAQAAYFVRQSDAAPGDLMVCDWERAGLNTADKDTFMRAVKKMLPQNKVGLYCNTSWWTGTDTSGYAGDFLWIAAYGPKPKISHEYLFWQYSDSPIDQNTGYFASRAGLKAWADGAVLPPTGGGAAGGTPTPSDDQEFIMTDFIDIRRDGLPQTGLVPGKQNTVKIGETKATEGNVTLAFGPKKRVTVGGTLAFKGLPAGQTVWIRVVRELTDAKGHHKSYARQFKARDANGSAGASSGDYYFSGLLLKDERLRVEVNPTCKGVTITGFEALGGMA